MECSVFRCFIPVSGQWCVHSGVAKGPQVRIEIMTSFLFSHTQTLSLRPLHSSLLPLYPSLSLSLPLAIHLSVSLSLGLSLPSIATSILCLSLSPPLSSVSRHLSLSLGTSLSPPPSHVSLSISPCLSISPSLHLYLSPHFYLNHLRSPSPKQTDKNTHKVIDQDRGTFIKFYPAEN